jgi:thioredoxin 1
MIQQSSDDELNKLLERIIQNMTTRPKSLEKSCCKPGFEIRGLVTIKSLEEFIRITHQCKITFILVTTTYCPYCHMFRPVFAKVAKLYEGKAAFVEVNADIIPEVAWSYNVFSTPTTIVILNGSPIDAIVGYIPFNSFNIYVTEILNKAGCINSG